MLRIFTYFVFFTLVQCPLSIVCPVLTCVPLTSSTNSVVLVFLCLVVVLLGHEMVSVVIVLIYFGFRTLLC